MTAARVNGVTIEYDEHGSGEPILLIMGLNAQLIAWPTDLVQAIAVEGYRVIRMDNRDIGLSSKTVAPAPRRSRLAAALLSPRLATSDYLISDMAADTAGLLHHLGIERAHVVGASMGGMIAQQLTIDHPRRVASLTSMMSNTGDGRHGRVDPRFLPTLRRTALARPRTHAEAVQAGIEAFRVLAGPHFDEEEIRALVESQLARSSDRVGRLRQLLAVQASPDRTAGLRRVTVPTLVIHGLADRLVTPGGGVATARAVPGARLVMFPEMGHDLPRARRSEMAEAIVRNARRSPFENRATA
jgi:pimeloyl-ACP methyl ester carboxylesterase